MHLSRIAVVILFLIIVLSGFCQQTVLMVKDEVPVEYKLVVNTYIDELKKFLVGSNINIIDEENISDIQNLKELIETGTMDRPEDIYEKWGLEEATKILKISILPNLKSEVVNVEVETELIDIKGKTLYTEKFTIEKDEIYLAREHALVNGKKLFYKLVQIDKKNLDDKYMNVPSLKLYTDKLAFEEGEEIKISFIVDETLYLSVFYVEEDSYLRKVVENKVITKNELHSLKGTVAWPIGESGEDYLETLLFLITRNKLDLGEEKFFKMEKLSNRLSMMDGIKWEAKLISYVVTRR